MKNKSVNSCRFVHHPKFHCIMTTLNKLFLCRQYLLSLRESSRSLASLGLNFPKVPKNAFFALVFQNIACSAEKLAKTSRVFLVQWESAQNKVDKIFEKLMPCHRFQKFWLFFLFPPPHTSFNTLV